MCIPTAAHDDITFGWLSETSNRLANVLRAHGVERGDRVAILLPQTPEVAAAHVAIYKLAAVALPTALLFGPDAISYRLQNSGAKALITNAQGLAKLAEIRERRSGAETRALDRRRGGRRAGFQRAAREAPRRISRRSRRRPTRRR